MVLARYLCSVQVLKFDEYFIKIVPNDPKSWSQIVELIRNGIPKRFFESGARILSIGHFSGWKSKFFEVSSWHFKHPIKLNFLIWHTQRLYPDKKSILEKRQFKSCPLKFHLKKLIFEICQNKMQVNFANVQVNVYEWVLMLFQWFFYGKKWELIFFRSKVFYPPH